MTLEETKELVKTLRELGVTHYKTSEIELNLLPEPPKAEPKFLPTVESNEEPQEIKHKVEELTSLLKLSDKDLIDRLFPDHTDYGDDEEASA